MATIELSSNDAIIAVDVQTDFCPGGALAVEQGDQVIPALNRWINAARKRGASVVASRDWHPPEHMSFKTRGGPWPVHCVQNSPGAQLHPELQLPPDALLITKGDDPHSDQYSAFDRTTLADQLRSRGINRLWIGGLAQDVCVRATALDALNEGFETHLLLNATRPVDPQAGRRTVDELTRAGAIIEQGTPDA